MSTVVLQIFLFFSFFLFLKRLPAARQTKDARDRKTPEAHRQPIHFSLFNVAENIVLQHLRGQMLLRKEIFQLLKLFGV